MRKRRERDGQKQSHWLEIVRRQAESGQSVTSYCRQAGIKESAFYWWRRELARRSQQGESLCQRPGVTRRQAAERPLARKSAGMAAGFLPVRVVAERRREAGCGVEILLGEGRRLYIAPGFDRQTLLDVLGVLEERGC
jgi:transposase-like protein